MRIFKKKSLYEFRTGRGYFHFFQKMPKTYKQDQGETYENSHHRTKRGVRALFGSGAQYPGDCKLRQHNQRKITPKRQGKTPPCLSSMPLPGRNAGRFSPSIRTSSTGSAATFRCWATGSGYHRKSPV